MAGGNKLLPRCSKLRLSQARAVPAANGHPGRKAVSRKLAKGCFSTREHEHEGLLPSPGGSQGMARAWSKGHECEPSATLKLRAATGSGTGRDTATDAAQSPCFAFSSPCPPPLPPCGTKQTQNNRTNRSHLKETGKKNNLQIPQVLYYPSKTPSSARCETAEHREHPALAAHRAARAAGERSSPQPPAKSPPSAINCTHLWPGSLRPRGCPCPSTATCRAGSLRGARRSWRRSHQCPLLGMAPPVPPNCPRGRAACSLHGQLPG